MTTRLTSTSGRMARKTEQPDPSACTGKANCQKQASTHQHTTCLRVRPGSAIGLATRYWPTGTWGEIFRTRPDRPWGPPSLLYNCTASFPAVQWNY